MFVAVGGDAGLVSPRPCQRNRALSGEHWAFLEVSRSAMRPTATSSSTPITPRTAPSLTRTARLPSGSRSIRPRAALLREKVVVGHTPQIDGRVLNLGHLVCIDTGCGLGGLLTAFDVGTGQVWQVDELGTPAP